MSLWNWLSRMLAVPACTSMSGTLLFTLAPVLSGDLSLQEAVHASPIFMIVGAVIGLVLGCPLVCIIDVLNWKSKYRYVIIGALGGTIGWLALEGAFADGAWNEIWSNPEFWTEWAPLRFLLFMVIGLANGGLYTGLVHLIDKIMPRTST